MIDDDIIYISYRMYRVNNVNLLQLPFKKKIICFLNFQRCKSDLNVTLSLIVALRMFICTKE